MKPIETNSQWYKKVFGNSGHSETTDYKRIELPDDISRISRFGVLNFRSIYEIFLNAVVSEKSTIFISSGTTRGKRI